MSDWSSAVSGMVMFRDGEAFLRLTPGAPSSSAPTSSASTTANAATAAPPWGVVRNDTAMMSAIEKNEVEVHPSRLPMSSKDLGTMLNNVQRALKITIGKNGDWSSEANDIFLKQLAKRKRIAKAIPQAILDAPLAIEDAKGAGDEESQVMDPGNTTEHNHNDDDKAVEHNQDEDHGSDESGSDDSSSTSSSSEASIERKKQIIRQQDTSTWTTGWHDAWESMKLVLDEGFHNAKRRRLAYKVLTALRDAKIEWDRS
ncbi:unnamed protein product [Symbiodinium sp. CCMP2592]|nr:unnamed protein product [Symbiodinium sp. CCMP2592]